MAKKPNTGVSFKSLKRRKRDTNGIWGHLANEDSFNIKTGFNWGLPGWILPTVAIASVITIVVLCFQVIDLQNHKVDGSSVVSKARPAVFEVSCGSAAGSAVGVKVPVPDGFQTAVFTAAHIFDECRPGDKIPVVASGRTYMGTLFKKDPAGVTDEENLDTAADIALIYLKAKLPSLDPAPEAQVGDWVVEIGNPIDKIDYATFGIITKVTDSEYFTDAATNKGNSGGPLLDSQARVLGLISYFQTVPEKLIDETIKNDFLDKAEGLSAAKRLVNACALIYSGNPKCPFNE
jgi:Trypsin-like peptidase domain